MIRQFLQELQLNATSHNGWFAFQRINIKSLQNSHSSKIHLYFVKFFFRLVHLQSSVCNKCCIVLHFRDTSACTWATNKTYYSDNKTVKNNVQAHQDALPSFFTTIIYNQPVYIQQAQKNN